jgi:hypothetical protein
MVGKTNLRQLLSSVAPTLLDDEYVFCTVANGSYGDYKELSPLASYREAEGLTLLITRRQADKHGIRYASVFKGITLTVHSGLDAVGLTAAVATTLAERGISANVIAAYHHDHIFVQRERAHEALAALNELARLQRNPADA